MKTGKKVTEPVCSVLIVNYNGGPLLVDCVQAVLDSTAALNLEVLVWDNASSDGSADLLAEVVDGNAAVRLWRHPVNLGFAGGVNKLLREAVGDWVLLLNPDCLLSSSTIAEVLAALEADPQAGMAGCLLMNPDGSEQAGCRRRIPTPWRSLVYLTGLDRVFPDHPGFQSLALCRSPLPTGTVDVEAISGAFMMIRRAALQQVGELDPAYFMHCEDVDWCMRFRLAGWRILFVPRAQAIHAKGTCSRNRTIFVEWHKHKGMMRFYRKFFRQGYPWPLLWFVAAGVWCRFVARMAGSLWQRWRPGQRRLPMERQSLVVESGHHQSTRIMVTGATSQIGYFLLPLLQAGGEKCLAVSRNPPAEPWPSGVSWRRIDLTRADPFAGSGRIEVWLHLAELSLAVPWLASAARAGVGRFLGIGSLSAITKRDSSSHVERQLAAKLQWAEKEIARLGSSHEISWTILRPTMIYGCGRDRNVSTILSFLRRFRFFPLVGTGRGARQPVHAADLARCALTAARSPLAVNRTYDLGGGQRLTYRQLVECLFESQGISPRFLPLPMFAVRRVTHLVKLLPPYRHLTVAMFERMEKDLVVDYTAASRDLGYNPRSFTYCRAGKVDG